MHAPQHRLLLLFFCPIRLIHVVGCAFLKLQSCWQAATLPFVSHRTQGLVQKIVSYIMCSTWLVMAAT